MNLVVFINFLNLLDFLNFPNLLNCRHYAFSTKLHETHQIHEDDKIHEKKECMKFMNKYERGAIYEKK